MVFRFFKQKNKQKTSQALAKTRRGWGGGLNAIFQNATLSDDSLWEELEDALISADVGVDTSLTTVNKVRQRVRDEGVTGSADVIEMFKEEMAVLLDPKDKTIWDWYDQEQLPVTPFVLMVVGVNGVGKTTSIAKMTKHYQELGKKVVIGAGDTFRAAAIEQLQVWGGRVKADVIAHQQGSDPGAVAYDAYEAAVARKADVLIFDTAGRLHTKGPLIEELRKVRRVFDRLQPGAPHQTLLVIDATTGHNGIEQATVFQEAVGVHGVFLTKLDGTAKGGITVAIAQELNLPVIFIGTGEGVDDVSLFDTDDFVDALFGDEPPT
ncbi:MAG: signal recognition particle-docking protein FtsY [Dehalococcoidia bacterium]